jgi:hypothetical protein
MTTDILAKLTQTNPHAVRAWVVKIISVSTVAGTCTIDPNDGDVVTDVPYWGLPPGVGSIQVALLFDGLLGVVSTGTGTIPVSGVWGQNLNGVAALDILGPLAETVDKYGAPIYLDSAGLLRSQPLIISGPDTNRLAADLIDKYPLGPSVLGLSTAQAASGGWPLSTASYVLTIKRDSMYGGQLWFKNDRTTYRIWYRTGDSTGWGAWAEVFYSVGGWKAIPLSGWKPVGAFTPQYRLETNGVVRLRGTLTKTAGGNLVSGETWATLPAEAAPKQNQYLSAMTSGFAAVRVDITTAGVCTLNAHSAVAASLGTNLAIDSISYDGGSGP